jgi:two-component system NtrC family response regulator
MATILIVDDMKNYLWMLGEILQQEGYRVLTSEKTADAKPLLEEGQIDLLLTDLRMEEEDGMALLSHARAVSPATSVIMMTAYGSIERAVEAIRFGAYDFILKPFNNADLLRSVAKALERARLVRENLRLSETLARQYRFDQLLGNSPAIREVIDKITRVADAKSTVLITGESGSGKELVARAIHFNGPRCAKPFLAVNCGALTQTLAESELFGHERGAFTGAASRHAGVFE